MAKKPSKSPNAKIVPHQYQIPKNGYDKGDFPVNISKLGGSGVTSKSFHIDHLKTKFRDLARPNLFKVKINPPSMLSSEWGTEIEVLLKSAAFPSVDIEEYAFEHAGSIIHVPTNKITYSDLTLTFWNDVDFKIRTLFNRWQRLAVFNWQQDIGCIPMLALEGLVTVYQYDSDHNEVYAVRVDNCWPKTISEIQLSHDNDSQAEDFSVTMHFTNHEVYGRKK